jgi:hypothetical protein
MVLLGGLLPAMATVAEKHFSGRLSHLDAKARTFAVMRDDVGATARETTFTLSPGARIMHRGKAMDLAKLVVGERVDVTYSEQDSVRKATWIEVLPPRRATPSSGTDPHEEP